ncbi:hypothetical protein LDENG_00166170 [Lucifuga dentata]|nr:hypothetical protein LDENG_00166170 [Lucifuga dentata]
MAYDRYIAICQPLMYHSVMTPQRVSLLVFISWFLPLYCMFMNTVTIYQAKLCGSHIHKLFCSNWLINKLACSTSIANIIIGYFNMAYYCCHFVFILWTYMYLVRICPTSSENRRKFMQTCVPHLVSLFNFGIAVLLDLMYMRFGSQDISQSLQNFMSIEFLLIPPLLNPLVYGLKLTKIKNRILSFIHEKKQSVMMM